MSCRCPSCSADPLPTWTPEWRLECEARALLAVPPRQRRLLLADPARAKRREALEQEMLRLWGEKKRKRGKK